MDSASLNSLIPLLDKVDKWVELLELLPVLVSLELVLSADNAVALASITKSLTEVELQRKALNIGISLALLFRVILIFMANIVLRFWPIQLLGGLYLLSLSINKLFIENLDSVTKNDSQINEISEKGIFKVIFLITLTDLAFSIDSVTAAVAISDQTLLVITGAVIGVIALRFTSELFIRWLTIYSRLENAGYLAVGLIGFKLIIELLINNIAIPEYLYFIAMLLIFIWGFSKKNVLIISE